MISASTPMPPSNFTRPGSSIHAGPRSRSFNHELQNFRGYYGPHGNGVEDKSLPAIPSEGSFQSKEAPPRKDVDAWPLKT